MKARGIRKLFVASALGLLGTALAGPGSGDTSVGVYVPLLGGLTAPLSGVGSLLYGAQEGVHSTVTGLTGIKVNHFYVWACVNGACLPVDPFTFSK